MAVMELCEFLKEAIMAYPAVCFFTSMAVGVALYHVLPDPAARAAGGGRRGGAQTIRRVRSKEAPTHGHQGADLRRHPEQWILGKA
ncbi:hypothetical protein EJB05_01252, partial [Eragrostis curvula]